jgi:hypothetical protein
VGGTTLSMDAKGARTSQVCPVPVPFARPAWSRILRLSRRRSGCRWSRHALRVHAHSRATRRVVVREGRAAPNNYTGSGPRDLCRVSGRQPCLRLEETLAVLVEHVDEHASCVRIDATIVCVLMRVETHARGLRDDGPS